MNKSDSLVDNGRPFSWSSAAADYAKFRDIYPPQFLQRIKELKLCEAGARVLDLGTGTGVLPRMLCGCGASFVGIDSSEGQIEQARSLSAGMDIEYHALPAEEMPFTQNTFDSALACQCFWYFDHELLCKRLSEVLKPGARFGAMVMEWLPYEDETAAKTEELILRYNPQWTGGGEVRHEFYVPECWDEFFDRELSEVFDLDVPFTRETWNGRIKSCRGIGAALSPEEVAAFEREHLAMLEKSVPESFTVKHYAAFVGLKNKKGENT